MAGRWWTQVRDTLRMLGQVPAAARMGGNFGRAFKLREQGRPSDALELAFEIFEAARGAKSDILQVGMVTAAGLIDELAQLCGEPARARVPLQQALSYINDECRRKPDIVPPRPLEHWNLLDSYARQFAARLRELPPPVVGSAQ